MNEKQRVLHTGRDDEWSLQPGKVFNWTKVPDVASLKETYVPTEHK
jgi:hypothetical protein